MSVRDIIAKFDETPRAKASLEGGLQVKGFHRVAKPRKASSKVFEAVEDPNSLNSKKLLQHSSWPFETNAGSSQPDNLQAAFKVPAKKEEPELPKAVSSTPRKKASVNKHATFVDARNEAVKSQEEDHNEHGKFTFRDIINPRPDIGHYISKSEEGEKYKRRLLEMKENLHLEIATNADRGKQVIPAVTEKKKESLMKPPPLPLIRERSHSQEGYGLGVFNLGNETISREEVSLNERVDNLNSEVGDVGNKQIPRILHKVQSSQNDVVKRLSIPSIDVTKETKRLSNPLPAGKKETLQLRKKYGELDESKAMDPIIHDTLLKLKGTVDALLEAFTVGKRNITSSNEELLQDIQKELDALNNVPFSRNTTPAVSFSPEQNLYVPTRNPLRLLSSGQLYFTVPLTPETPSTFKVKVVTPNRIENGHIFRSSSKQSSSSLRTMDSFPSNGARSIVSIIGYPRTNGNKDLTEEDTETSEGRFDMNDTPDTTFQNTDSQPDFTPRTVLCVEDTLTCLEPNQYSQNTSPCTPDRKNMPITVFEVDHSARSSKAPSFFKRLMKRKRLSGNGTLHISLPEIVRGLSPGQGFDTPRPAPSSPLAAKKDSSSIESATDNLLPEPDREIVVDAEREMSQPMKSNGLRLEAPTESPVVGDITEVARMVDSQPMGQLVSSNTSDNQMSVVTQDSYPYRGNSDSTTTSAATARSKHHYWRLLRGSLPGHRLRKSHGGNVYKSFSHLSLHLVPASVALRQSRNGFQPATFSNVVEFIEYIDSRFLLNDLKVV